jgi:hypothetical protein
MDLHSAFALLPSVQPDPATWHRDSASAFTPMLPPSGSEPPTTHRTLGRASARWCYLDDQGRLQGYVCRFDRPGGKEFRPLRYGVLNDRAAWHWHGWSGDMVRPLYRLPNLLADPAAPVLVVEGEKVADAAAALLPTMVAVSPMNGAQSPHQTDWSPLAARTVVVWPDADQPGRAFADRVAKLALRAGASAVGIVAVPEALPPGWDLADPLPAGWT